MIMYAKDTLQYTTLLCYSTLAALKSPTVPAKAACATCGLFGHEASACPFAHPEESERGQLLQLIHLV